MPKVSVIIPVYNVEKYLRQCLDSVVNQTLQDIEIICVDDGSTDNSLNILKEYATKDSRIIILQQENLHAGVARNNGLKIAKGKYVHFLDSDDWIELYAYEELYQIIENVNADFVKFKSYSYNNVTNKTEYRAFCDIKWIDSKYFEHTLNIYDDTKNTLELPDSPWSGFYKREFLQQNNIFFDDFVCANDVGFFYRCIINAKNIYLSSKRLLYYRENIKNSLVARRAKNFDCQIALYSVVNHASKDLPLSIRDILINKIINSCFAWYKKIIYNHNLSNRDKQKIKNEMISFIFQIKDEKLTNETINNLEDILQIMRKRFFDKIFYSRNIGAYRVINLFGIKFKFKSIKNIEKSRYENFENRINYLLSEFVKLKIK